MKYLNEIVHGNCLDLIDELPDESIDGACIDPPYGEGFDFDGDSNIREAKHLLAAFLVKLKPKLKQNGHIAIFWTMRNVDVCIEQLKQNFTYRRVLSMYLPKGNARPYLGWLPRTQAIVIGQKYVPGQPTEFHSELATYLYKKMIESGHTRSSLAKILGCDSRLVMKWTRPGDPSFCLPVPKFYKQLKEILDLDSNYDMMLVREPTNKSYRQDFEYKHDCYIVDDKNEKMIHPCQKPLLVISHLVSCICPEGGIVLDGFCGSGTTAVAAKNTGRNFICFEKSDKFVEIAKSRLQNTK